MLESAHLKNYITVIFLPQKNIFSIYISFAKLMNINKKM